jgi:uncharacterized membrane protein YjjP (DUF1212 family)
MDTVVVCTVLLVFGASITLYSEDGWLLLLVAIILAAAFFFWLFLSRHSRPSFVFFEQPRSDDETDGVLE